MQSKDDLAERFKMRAIRLLLLVLLILAWLNLLERRLVESHATVIIPFDDRVLFVRLLNCAEFPRRLSEVTQTLDAISGIQFLVGGEGSTSGGFLARSESGVAPGYDSGGLGVLYAVWVSAYW